MSSSNPAAAAFLERLQSRRPKLECVELKNLGTVYMRRPTGEDQAKIATIKMELTKEKLAQLPQTVFAAVMGSVMLLQEDGTPYFEDAQKGFEALNQIDADDLRDLYHQIMRISGNSEKGLEDAEKKSSSGQTSGPGTN